MPLTTHTSGQKVSRKLPVLKKNLLLLWAILLHYLRLVLIFTFHQQHNFTIPKKRKKVRDKQQDLMTGLHKCAFNLNAFSYRLKYTLPSSVIAACNSYCYQIYRTNRQLHFVMSNAYLSVDISKLELCKTDSQAYKACMDMLFFSGFCFCVFYGRVWIGAIWTGKQNMSQYLLFSFTVSSWNLGHCCWHACVCVHYFMHVHRCHEVSFPVLLHYHYFYYVDSFHIGFIAAATVLRNPASEIPHMHKAITYFGDLYVCLFVCS